MRKSMIALCILVIFIVVVVVIVSNTNIVAKRSSHGGKFELDDLNFDDYQMIIYNAIIENHELGGVPFITYERIGSDTDNFYKREYLYAMISGIDSELTVHNSYAYPFALVYDLESGDLIRSYFPDANLSFDYEEYYANIPFELHNKINLPREVHIDRIDKFSDTNIWKAKTYFGIEDEVEELYYIE